MRNATQMVSGLAIALAANADAGAAPTAAAVEMKLYQAAAGARNAKDNSADSDFVIKAASYKKAWELAREVTRTGSADFVETHGAGVLMTSKTDESVPTVKAGQLSIRAVVSLAEKRSKKDALTVDRLLEVCGERGVKIPGALQSLIDELNEAGPATTAAEAATGDQASA